ncbi:MAG TPA: sialidase family protein [Streptosporangiaceae bacterium]
MADRHDGLDEWMNAQVQPLPPPPGTFELIRKRARRRKMTRAAAAAAGAAAVIAVIATVPRLVITQLNVSPGPASSGRAAGDTSSAAHHHHHQASASPTAIPSTPPPATAPPAAPPNFQATSVTFVGLSTGFVLGQAGTPGHCGPPSAYICTSIAGTGDHGGTWHGVSAPVTGAPSGPSGVSQVRFYNTSDGWAFGPQLWATHDGGRTWTRIGTHGLRVTALETAGQRVFAVWAQCSGGGADFAAGCTSSALYSAAPGGDQWAPVPGAGTGSSLGTTPGSSALVLTGSRGYLLAPDGTLLSGPVTSAGGWQPVTGTASSRTAPCPPGAAQASGQPSGALLAATTISGLVLVCTSPAAGATQAKTVYTSSDNGQQWQKAGTGPGAGTATSVAGTTAGTIVLATTAGLEVSADGGATWTAAQGALPAGGFSYVGMTSPQQGVAVPADTAQHAVWFTFDGGRSWRASPIG